MGAANYIVFAIFGLCATAVWAFKRNESILAGIFINGIQASDLPNVYYFIEICC